MFPHRPCSNWAESKTRAQFNALNAASELFNNEFEGFPSSEANDVTGAPYCGAMKLTEAVMGQDLLGCNSDSALRRDGLNLAGGKKPGMPILYYRADSSWTAHDGDDPDNPANIYRYMDNQMLLALGVPGEPKKVHPLSDPKCFHRLTQSARNRKQAEPYRRDAFILISAGYDGLYGTVDDVYNFDRRR
jgi:hypothetical protein